jgi:hypothetical protein
MVRIDEADKAETNVVVQIDVVDWTAVVARDDAEATCVAAPKKAK